MVIQSSVLRVILGRDIPFVYPNHECTQLHKPPSSLDGVCHHANILSMHCTYLKNTFDASSFITMFHLLKSVSKVLWHDLFVHIELPIPPFKNFSFLTYLMWPISWSFNSCILGFFQPTTSIFWPSSLIFDPNNIRQTRVLKRLNTKAYHTSSVGWFWVGGHVQLNGS
jgi:hypothetical protein